MFNIAEPPVNLPEITTTEELKSLLLAMVNNNNLETSQARLGQLLVAIVDYFANTPPGQGLATVITDSSLTGDGTVDTPLSIATNGVTSTKINASAVTASKIATDAVTTSKINAAAVTTDKIADGNVTGNKIADNAVTNTKVPNGELTLAKLAQSGASLNQVPKWNGSAWAPGDDNSGGGGGLPQVYDAGNGCLVAASGPGVEFGISPGIGLISVPEGVIVYSAFVQGDLDDLLSNNIDIALGWTSGTPPFNANLASIFPPTVTKYNRITSNGNPGTDPWIIDVDNTPLLAVSGVNPIKIRGINMNGITYWGLRIDFI